MTRLAPKKTEETPAKTKRKYVRTKRSSDCVTLTPRETIPITGLSVPATYWMLREGKMPAIKVGKRFFIPKAALMNWLATAGGSQIAK